MATQNASGIEFNIVAEESRQHFRLLELPPDLLSVITSDNPPALQLKSLEGPPGHALESNAVLCTSNKTYSLRQVSTSNEVYLTHASSDSDSFSSQPRLEAIAKCDSTLEVQLAKNCSAKPYIKAALPVYATTGHYDSKAALTKTELFSNIPLSDVECMQAWQDLACFELKGADDYRALVPSSATKMKVWEGVLTSSTAESIDLTGSIDRKDVSTITNEHDDWPSELITAVLGSMRIDSDDSSEGLQLDETKCVCAVGEMLLQVRTENGRDSISVKSFTEAWANMLPEKWRGRADMSLLEGYSVIENGGMDVHFGENNGTTGSDGKAAATPDAKSTLGAKRKWHEKFRASKKTA